MLWVCVGLAAYLAVKAEGAAVWTALSVMAWMLLIFTGPLLLLAWALERLWTH